VGKVKEYVEGVLDKKEIFLNLQKLLMNHKMIMNHNDSNISNILVLNHIESENPEIQLLDFEFANLNYIGYDIGNLLNEIATDYGGAYSVNELGNQHKF
jgi:thiamine kinase-like enzyme